MLIWSAWSTVNGMGLVESANTFVKHDHITYLCHNSLLEIAHTITVGRTHFPTWKFLEVESNWIERNWIDFYRIFKLFFTFRINWIINFRIESNEFRMNPISDDLTLTSSWSRIEWIKFKLNFIKFFQCFLPFRINRIAKEPFI